eukprot:SAG22_NODE_576_length_8982_cov_21.167736_7_plen_75_part_00
MRSVCHAGAQEQLLRSVAAVQQNVVVVLIHGGPIDVSWAEAAPSVKAIVAAFQPGALSVQDCNLGHRPSLCLAS